MTKNVETAEKLSRIRQYKRNGRLLLLRAMWYWETIIIASFAEPFGRISRRKMIKIGSIHYTGDIARIELLLPKYLGEWIENQAKKARISPSVQIKTWLLKIYSGHAERVSK